MICFRYALSAETPSRQSQVESHGAQVEVVPLNPFFCLPVQIGLS